MERNTAQKVYKWIMFILITIIITSMITAFATYQYITNNGRILGYQEPDTVEGLENTLAKFRTELEKKYIGEINDEKLIEGAIKGYIAALNDPYTTYYTKAEMDEIMEETEGNYVGIGIYMTMDTDKNAIVVVNPIENSPAEEAGILPGDLITKINGESFSGDDLEQASKKIKGEAGTKVTLEILRNGETKTVELTRRKVSISHITAKVIENNIGYIAISDFEGECAEEFKTKYEELSKKNIKKLIIDIRNNGGGIVDEATKIADFMTEKDSVLLITKDKNGNEDITKSKNKPIINMPTVVLMNEYSASASEILAGALKDNGKATLVGEKTYGKGVIQELQRLSDGSGLKITTNEYYTPNRNVINKVGIEPDITVNLPSDLEYQSEIPEENDTQLQKAIETLKGMN